jgi:hypothetical protein
MLELHFEVATVIHWRHEIIGDLINYKAHVFITFLLAATAQDYADLMMEVDV